MSGLFVVFVAGAVASFAYTNGSSWVRDGDMRALITVVLIIGCVAISVLDITLKAGTGSIPDWLLGFTGPIVGYFFRDQSASRDAQRVADASTAHQNERNTVMRDRHHSAQQVEVVNPIEHPVPIEDVRTSGQE